MSIITIHPFYSDAVIGDILAQTEKPLSQQQQNIQKHYHYKDLVGLLSWNNANSQCFNSTDSSLSVTTHAVLEDDFNRLKYLIRSVLWPINHYIRRQMWMNILTLNRVRSSKQPRHVRQSSQATLTSTIVIIDNDFSSLSSNHNQLPNFVDTTNLCFYHLNEPTGHSLLQRVLFTFALHHPDVTYCPTLQPFSALLLHYHTEYEVLYLINRLLVKNWLCGVTRLQWEAHCNVFMKLVRLYYKSAADIIDLRFANMKSFYQEWFWWIFRYLPFTYLTKIMDCFFLEGPKILFRISLALVHLYTKRIKDKSNKNPSDIADFCQHIPVSIDHLLRVAFDIRNFKRRTIDQLIENEEKLLRSTHQQPSNDNAKENSNSISHGIISDRQPQLVASQHLTQIPNKSILDHKQFLTLWNWLPVRFSIAQPSLVFTTEEHGFRLQTLLNKIDEIEYSILIIKATNGEIFGAFCAGLWSDRHKRAYFGFGETFLFTLVPKQIKYSWVGQQHDDSNRQNQAKREMFLYVNNEKLVIGGGNGDGLCIDQSLCEGLTTHCDTFNNEPLCSQSYFSISVLEMIAFDFSES
ncbi:unnamed protein product [Adineta steineri]|uniref:TBC1 domain family member 24 n=1 Tax=Adineta steineri TaxID=433720 RepID=A0A818KHS3_9BILA|nr:unnamed protein product [Adineta steineri]CAF3551870.1 unnamed protein product [Adineta steineri]